MNAPSTPRRQFLLGSAALATSAWLSGKARGAVVRMLPISDYPFKLGVASGDPDEHGFVLWTRLAPDPLNGGGMPHQPVRVQWEIADDEAFKQIVHGKKIKKWQSLLPNTWKSLFVHIILSRNIDRR